MNLIVWECKIGLPLDGNYLPSAAAQVRESIAAIGEVP